MQFVRQLYPQHGFHNEIQRSLLSLYNHAMPKYTLQRLCTENLNQLFLEMKLCGLVPKSYIHLSVSDLAK